MKPRRKTFNDVRSDESGGHSIGCPCQPPFWKTTAAAEQLLLQNNCCCRTTVAADVHRLATRAELQEAPS